MKHSVAFLAAAAASFAVASPASAATLLYQLSGDYTASWQLDSNPIPDVSSSGVNFTIWDVEGFPDAIFGVADITFWHADELGGFTIEDFYIGSILAEALGPQLYSGPESSPTMLTGTFQLTGVNGESYTLNVSTVGGVVPEPATWAMMVLGFGVLGGAMRGARRTRKTVQFAF